MEFRLPFPAFRVDALVTAWRNITLSAFDDEGNQVATTTIAPVTADAWRNNRIVVADSSSAISRIKFSGDYMLLDQIMINDPNPVPEPTAVPLLASAVLAISLRRKH